MKRVIAVHDLSGLGRCSLNVALPVLAAMGVRVCPLPTAVLSAHTAFPSQGPHVFQDLTGQMPDALAHWKELGLVFDGFYSGFLGSAEQMYLLMHYLQENRSSGFLAMVDPVMGDHGSLYRTYTIEMCQAMIQLAAQADIITPNLTEAALLLSEPYDPSPRQDKVRRWLERLSLDGHRSVAITGITLSPGKLGASCLDRATGRVHTAQAPDIAGSFSGTGDLFASVTFGCLMQGRSLADAVEFAVDFVSQAAEETFRHGGDPLEGADFELLLPRLAPENIPPAHPLGL